MPLSKTQTQFKVIIRTLILGVGREVLQSVYSKPHRVNDLINYAKAMTKRQRDLTFYSFTNTKFMTLL